MLSFILTNADVLLLAIAAILDFFIGDPWSWPHPVQAMGWCIQRYTKWALDTFPQGWSLRLVGIVLTLGMVIGGGVVAWGVIAIATFIHPLLGLVVGSVALASCFAGRSLRDAAEDVLQPLTAGDISTARTRLALYVGRDTQHLDEAEIYRAVFETVTENATDGVMAPLFYAIVGMLLPVGSVPLAIAYKATSTLDSMVGYRTPPYTDLGWFSAKLDDVLTWIPCRLTVFTIGLLSGTPRRVWQVCCRDAPQDPSPNAGWSECVYAAALKVQVGGTNVYQGQVKYKPKLGDAIDPLTAQKVQNALWLTRWAFLIWLGVALFNMAFTIVVKLILQGPDPFLP